MATSSSAHLPSRAGVLPGVAVLASILAVRLIACSGEAAVEPAAPLTPALVTASDVPTYADFVVRDATLRCQQFDPICARFGQERRHSCDDSFSPEPHPDAAVGTYVPEAAAACLNERAAVPFVARASGEAVMPDAHPTACDELFRTAALHTKAVGEPCVLHSDCLAVPGGRVSCEGLPEYERICRVVLRSSAGEACQRRDGGPQRICEVETTCDGLRHFCVPLPSLGEPCFQGQCLPGAHCTVGTEIRTCAPLLQTASPCSEGTQCASGYCGPSGCAELGRVGAACPSNAACATGICDEGRCGRTYLYKDYCE